MEDPSGSEPTFSNAHPHAPAVLVLDVDGVMTDGKSYYTADGKLMKVFGPDDHDALCVLAGVIQIQFVSGDRRGFEISRARVGTDMGFPIELVSSVDRLSWISERWDPACVIYIGDGIFDARVFAGVGYAIAPRDADADACAAADYVTRRTGGDRAVAEACKHIMDRFFGGAAAMLASAGSKDAAAVAGGWGHARSA
jgi:3-deoxy-D-manno-octulosonate 8-phosphate phosphatase (KDO 8-P phosphatase)